MRDEPNNAYWAVASTPLPLSLDDVPDIAQISRLLECYRDLRGISVGRST
jgi:hypothetical protein